MFNQTTPGWMHWSSLPDTAGFLDTAGLQTSRLRPQPPLSQRLCRAMPLHVMTEQVIHGRTSWCKKNNFTHHFPMPSYIDHSSMVGPYATQTRTPQSSSIQMLLIPEAGHTHRDLLIALSMHMNGKNKTGISEMPSRHREIKGKVRRSQLTRCIERLQRGMQAQLMGWGSEIKVGSPGKAGL